ncbi:MAG: TetR family transcriptional regulator [Acidimicrobiia bacterium]|nr:TetR family transcriptional regulator [Acidimicrobiia bacterium]
MPGPGAQSRREQILLAAARLFRAHGYHGTSIDELGTAVGISGPALYRHFPSKAAVLAALAERGIDRMAELVEDSRRSAEPTCALAGAVRALVHRVRRDRDLAAVVLREARHLAPELARPSQAARRRLDRALLALLLEARPELGADQARLLVAAFYGLLTLPLAHRSQLGERQFEDLLVAAAMSGLGAGEGERDGDGDGAS